MKKAILLLFLTITGLFSQIAPEWITNYPLSSVNSIKMILNDNSGNFYTLSHSNVDSLNSSGGFLLLSKSNSAGVLLWKRFYSRPGLDSGDFPISMTLDNQSNIYILDASHGLNSGIDLGAVKYDQNGIFKWDYFYTSTESIYSYDNPEAILTDNQGNCYLTGTASNYLIDSIITIKLNSSGAQQWKQTYIKTSTRLSTGKCLAVDNTLNLYTGGMINDTGSSFLNAVILKYNSSGVLQWSKTYSGPQSTADCFIDMKFDNAGNLIATGSSDGDYYFDSASVLLQKYTPAGSVVWTQVYHTVNPGGEIGCQLLIDNSDNIFVLGRTQYYEGAYRNASFILKYNSSGSILWSNRHGDYFYNPVFARNFSFDNGNNILVTGYENRYGRSNLLLLKYNYSTGNKDWTYLFNRTGSSADAGFFAGYVNNSLFIAGKTNNDLLLMKMTNTNTFSNTFRRSNLNKPVLDSQYTYDTIYLNTEQMPPEAYLKSINLTIDTLIHSSIGDIEMTLRHGYFEDTVIYRRGGTFDNMIGTNLNDTSLQNICSGGLPPFTGYFAPCKTMLRHINMPATGPWILEIFDRKAPDTGYLRSWALTFSYEVPIGINNQSGIIPEKFALYQNYPNPFNPVTKIKYAISVPSITKITVYDINGKEIKSLINKWLNSGTYETEFDGSMLASGVYFYKLETGNYSEAKKMVLIR